jgi:hypothetical protein
MSARSRDTIALWGTLQDVRLEQDPGMTYCRHTFRGNGPKTRGKSNSEVHNINDYP